jgi:hypothetical protein
MANQTTERERSEPAEAVAVDETRARRAANLLDLRRLIGGLFLIYGAILTVVGAGASQEEIDKAAGVNLNLWVGLSLLVVGALFLAWAFARPLSDRLEEGEGPAGDDRTVRGAPALAGSQTTSRRARRDRTRAAGDGRFRR